MIHGLDSRFLAVDGCYFIGSTISMVELCVVWIDIIFARLRLKAERLVIEGDSAMVVAWLSGKPLLAAVHPLIHDGQCVAGTCLSFEICYIY